MSLLSPDTFAVALVSLMRMQREARQAYLENRLRKNESAKTVGLALRSMLTNVAENPQDVAGVYSPKAWVWAATVAVGDGWCDPGKEFDGVLEIDRRTNIPGPVFDQGKPVVLDEARFQQLVARALLKRAQVKGEFAANMTAMMAAEQTEWVTTWLDGKKPVSPWGRFASSMLDMSLDVLAQRPEILGGGRTMRGLIAASLPHIAAAYSPNDPEAGVNASRLSTAFAEGAIQTLIEKPDLVSTEPRWQVLVTGMLTPLQTQIRDKGIDPIIAEGRLRDLFAGPMAAEALKVVSQNADDYLKGSASKDRLAGVVIRATFGEYLASPNAFSLRKVFSEESIGILARKTITAAQERPELFLRSDDPGAGMETARKFLSDAAKVLGEQALLRRFDKAFAGDLLGLAIDTVAAHTLSRLEAKAGASLQAQLGAALATSLVRDIFAGFRDAVTAPAGAAPVKVFDRFGRTQMMDLIQTIAEYAAKSPKVFLGDKVDPHVVMVARTIAETIAADEDGLLTPGDWQLITLSCMNAALENPNTLFGDSSSGIIAKRLILLILAEARENVSRNKDGPGEVLFGKILSDAIVETLDVASTGVLNVLKDEAKLTEHLTAVKELVARLNALAASKNTRLVIGSREWIRIYRFYIADVLQRGAEAISELTDERLLDVLKVSQVPLGPMEDAG